MNINRNNFEEFCLLYLDGELNQAERQELEAFVAANPDLAVELELLQQLKLKPEMDAPVSFDKSTLFRSSAMENESIHKGNYETYFLLYTDDELDAERRKSVEQFVADHPEYQKELNLLQSSRLVAEPIAFPDKSLLYRETTQPARITVMRYWRVAAAAAVILGGIWIGFNTQKNVTVEPGVAKVQTDKVDKKAVPGNEIKKENKQEPVVETVAANTEKSSTTEPERSEPARALALNKNRESKQESKVGQKEIKPESSEPVEQQSIAKVEQPSNNLPVPDHTTTSTEATLNTETNSNAVTRINPDVDVRDRAAYGPNAESAKNDFASEALLSASETKAYTTNYVQEDDHKSPLRGVFRKASRMINRVTNPDIFKQSSKQNK